MRKLLSLRNTVAMLGLLLSALAVCAGEGIPEDVMDLHREAVVCDLHADTQFMITYMGYDMAKRHRSVDWGPAGVLPIFSDIDIPRLREGGIDLFNMAICPSPKTNKVPGATGFVRRSLDALDRMADENSDKLAVARSPEEARQIIRSGRIAILLAVEGGQGINNDLAVLDEFYQRGVRYMTLTHAKSLAWAESANPGEETDFNGLTSFGKKVVRKMEKMGMMIDLAHVSERTFWATLDTVDCPVIVTHAGARGAGDHYRNLTDEQILAVADRGGVIGVIFHADYLDPQGEKPRDAALVADHIDYIKELAGVDVIALGSDYDGGVNIPPELGHAGRLPALTAELVRRGYTETEIKKILGENFLRAWQRTEEHARQ
ncbi:MAG: dipeptidase [bacterium]